MSFSKFRFLLGVLLFLSILSCKKETTDNKTGAYEKGLLIVNEGLFQTGKGTISWLNPSNDLVTHEIFESANNGQILGNIAQSASYDSEHFYIAVNNSAKIVVADRKDFTFKREIPQLNQVRYTQPAPGSRLLASAWGDGFSGSFFILNSMTGEIIYRIEGLKGPERFYRLGEEVFLTCSGGFGNHDQVLKIDLQQGVVKDSFVLSDRPESIVSANGQLFVLCSGNFDFLDPQNNTPGALFRYNGSSFEKLREMPNGSRSLVALTGTEYLYFLNRSELGQYNYSTAELKYESLNVASVNGLSGIEWKGSPALAISDAKDYISRGDVHILSSSGQFITKIEAGIIPGQVVLVE